MTTETKTEGKQKLTIEEIWNNLEQTDKEENQFQFSNCKDRYIVVLGSKKTDYCVVGDIIQNNTYGDHNLQQINEERETRTYVTVHDNPLCDVCVITLIDLLPLEHFIKRAKSNSEDPSPSPMAEIDKTIDKFATSIDLIILVCQEDNFELMKNMKKWASDRGHVMALVFIVDPNLNMEQREKIILSTRGNKEFADNELGDLFDKGIYCISDLSRNDFKTLKEREMAQRYVTEWRQKFLQRCVGGMNDKPYTITIRDDIQSKNSSCSIS
jgi:hypothetical protein